MILLFDETDEPKRFPLSILLDEIGRHFGIRDDDVVPIIRIGGQGFLVWRIESIIDDGGSVSVPYGVIKDTANSDEDFFDELLCVYRESIFGISDASFMFVQHKNKDLEQLVASRFNDIKHVPDMVVS